jgi:hypothetical protein
VSSIVFKCLKDRIFISHDEFTQISSWLELSMKGYLFAISVYVERELEVEVSNETAKGNAHLLHRNHQ